jgi:hypothetical protein
MNHRSKLRMTLGAFLAIAFVLACDTTVSIPTSIAPFIASISPPISTTTPQPTPKIKCPNGDCANICIGRLTSLLQNGSQPSSPSRGTFSHRSSIQPIVLVAYPVNGDQIGSPQFASNIPASLTSYQHDTVDQQKLWSFFTTIIPSDQRQAIVSFMVATDGPGKILAYVEQSSSNPADWELAVDIMDASTPKLLTYTLVHEFGHLLTLNESQVTPDTDYMANPNDQQIYQQGVSACPQYFTDNGCSKPNSYINQFFNKFWVKIYPAWSQMNSEKDQSNYDNLRIHFYLNHAYQFVTPYAVTSPEEDIAETWAHFVLTQKPSGDSIASQKILFFYQYPELVQLRNQIVYGLCNYALGQ